MTTSFLKVATELERFSGNTHDRLGVVAVDVEDRCLNSPSDVGGVDARARGGWGGGEAHLVVDDDVHGATGPVAAQLRELEGLGDDTLTGECGVAVHQDGQHGETGLTKAEQVLLGAGKPLENGADCLEVAGVRYERHIDGRSVRRCERALGAEVVLHVTGTLNGLEVEVALELAEDLPV